MIPKTIENISALLSNKLKKMSLIMDFQQYLQITFFFFNHSSDNVVKDLEENDFYHLSEEFEVDILDLVGTALSWDSFVKFKGLPTKDKFYNSLINCAICDKIYEQVRNIQGKNYERSP